VEEGKLADLVLLSANPLEDISNTQKIAGVFANGRYFYDTEIEKMLKEVESAAQHGPVTKKLGLFKKRASHQ
jgi:hypothetical protein